MKVAFIAYCSNGRLGCCGCKYRLKLGMLVAMLEAPRDDSTKYAKTNGLTFCPPLPNRALQWLIKTLLPFLMYKPLQKLQVDISDAAIHRLREKRGERCLLLPNHPAQWDPWVILHLSKLLGENFFYVVAREVFDWHRGLQGVVLQRMGCYSVVRGASDRDSFKTTKSILASNAGRLVVFVEGEISNQNDSLLPLEPGVIQLAFLSLQEIYKDNGKALADLPNLWVFPIGLKYLYETQGLENTIDKALSSLEEATGLDGTHKTRYQRIQAIGQHVLQETARQFGFPLSYTENLNAQIRGLEHFMLNKMENVVNLPFDSDLSYLDRVRRIRNTVDKVLRDTPDNPTLYHQRLLNHQKAVLKNFYWDLDRIVNFIAIYDGYLHPEMTPERYVEIIRRLEKEVFGSYRLTHPRTARVQVLEPLNLKDHFESFLSDRKRTAETIIRQIETALYSAIGPSVLPPRHIVL